MVLRPVGVICQRIATKRSERPWQRLLAGRPVSESSRCHTRSAGARRYVREPAWPIPLRIVAILLLQPHHRSSGVLAFPQPGAESVWRRPTSPRRARPTRDPHTMQVALEIDVHFHVRPSAPQVVEAELRIGMTHPFTDPTHGAGVGSSRRWSGIPSGVRPASRRTGAIGTSPRRRRRRERPDRADYGVGGVGPSPNSGGESKDAWAAALPIDPKVGCPEGAEVPLAMPAHDSPVRYPHQLLDLATAPEAARAWE